MRRLQRFPVRTLTSLCALTLLIPVAMAQSFVPGNLLVVRAGDGTQTLVNTGNSVFLDEFDPASKTGLPVRSIALPAVANAPQRQCLLSGTATSEGQITLAGNGAAALVACYGRDLGGTGSLANSTSATVPRVVAVVRFDGSFDTSTALTDAHSGNNIRSAASVDGSVIYTAGGNEGVRLSNVGATTSSVVSAATATGALTNLRTLGIAGGNLFVTTASGTNPRLLQVGTGLPTAPGTLMAGVPGMPTDRSFYAFSFADRSIDIAGVDTLYVADDSGTAPGAGILKYSLVGGTWVSNGRVNAIGVRGLVAGQTSFGFGVAYVAEALCADGTTGSSRLCAFVDEGGYNQPLTPQGGAPVTLAIAGTNTVFRGVTAAPVAPDLIFANGFES
jgi:hypothetical protein